MKTNGYKVKALDLNELIGERGEFCAHLFRLENKNSQTRFSVSPSEKLSLIGI